jgi:hypothetical protein
MSYLNRLGTAVRDRYFWRTLSHRTALCVPTIGSSSLQWLVYDRDSATLEICFKGDRCYRYDQVPASAARGLVEASSRGGYYNQSIKGNYTCWKLVG